MTADQPSGLLRPTLIHLRKSSGAAWAGTNAVNELASAVLIMTVGVPKVLVVLFQALAHTLKFPLD